MYIQSKQELNRGNKLLSSTIRWVFGSCEREGHSQETQLLKPYFSPALTKGFTGEHPKSTSKFNTRQCNEKEVLWANTTPTRYTTGGAIHTGFLNWAEIEGPKEKEILKLANIQ